MIAERLKIIREKKKHNKKNFAIFLGIPYTTYNNYETGTREPSSDFFKLISNKCNVSIDYIIGVSDDYEIKKNYSVTQNEKDIINKYRKLSTKSKSHIEYILDHEIDITITKNEKEKKQAEIDAKTESYRRELEAEAKGNKKLSVSQITKEA